MLGGHKHRGRKAVAQQDFPKIVLFAPGRIKRYPRSTMARFYTRVHAALEENGYRSVIKHKPYKVPEQNGLFYLTYHTLVTRPDILNVKGGYLHDYMLLDEAGYSGWASVVDAEPEWMDVGRREARQFMKALRRRYINAGLARYHRMSEATEHDIPDGYVAIYLQCQDDTVMTLKRFETEEMVRAIIAQRGDRAVVIKRHPLCESPEIEALLEEVVDPEAGVYQSQQNVHEISARASAVACVNSGAGFDSLLHGRKVMVFGVSDYRHAAFEITDLSQVGEVIEGPGHDASTISRYLYWYLNRRSVHVDSPDLGKLVIKRIRARNGVEHATPRAWERFPPNKNAA